MSIEYPNFSTLSVQELLSLTLREKQSSPIVEELAAQFANLGDLAEATFAELTGIKGLGPGRASAILAFVELARRLYTSPPEERPVIRCPQDIADLVMPEMRYLDREHFRVILLNTKNHVIKVETVSVGTLNSSAVHPRELFKSAVKNSAASIIMLHNHPSGDPTPSREDLDITKRLADAGNLLGISVLDHLIIGDGRYVSFKESGLL